MDQDDEPRLASVSEHHRPATHHHNENRDAFFWWMLRNVIFRPDFRMKGHG